jgi:hypothetical protein
MDVFTACLRQALPLLYKPLSRERTQPLLGRNLTAHDT